MLQSAARGARHREHSGNGYGRLLAARELQDTFQMQPRDALGCLVWLALVAGYVAVVHGLGAVVKLAPQLTDRRRPLLTLVRAARRVSPPKPSFPRRMMTISTLLSPDLVLHSLAVAKKADVLDALAALVGRMHPHVDARRLADALHERERQSTTALENGIAIPHVRLAGLPGPLVAFARTTSGIPCDAVDGRPTRVFLLVVAPAEQPGGLLKLLAEAARVLSDGRCRGRLLQAESAEELVAVLREHEERVHRGLHAA
jgi:mannitol/fructose-specific phosphotransferase system IIA component (Ntr-type)